MDNDTLRAQLPQPHRIVALDPGPTDAERAADIKARLRAASEVVVEIMNEAKRAGLIANINIGPNAFGIWVVNDTTVVKPL